jgi:hypothetical protein
MKNNDLKNASAECRINDNRTVFVTTFSNYKKSLAVKELMSSIYYQKKNDAYFWTAELLCSNCIIDIWDTYIEIMCKYTHIYNPKIPIYLHKKFLEFKEIAGKTNDDIQLRNIDEIRRLFFSLTLIFCSSKRECVLDTPTFQFNFEMDKMYMNLKAPNVSYIQNYFKNGDPKEYYIPLNELMYHLKETKNKMDIFYWIEWIIAYDSLLLKNKKQLQCVKREFAVNTNIIWIIWELLLSFDKQPIESLLHLFSIKYKNNKKKKCILHLCVMYIITKVDYNIPILDSSLLKNIEESITMTFEKIKKKEIA